MRRIDGWTTATRLLLILLAMFSCAVTSHARERWSEAAANNWYAKQPWLVGANYTPATAINSLEMWQADTFDPKRIDLEFGWAESLGMNTMRVFLHDLLWQQDLEGFKKRIDQFLRIASKHHIRPLFVLFDSCWDPNPHLGKQHAPVPGVHNSGWPQSPGASELEDPAQEPKFEAYVKGVVGAFAQDERVLGWDVWNEPTVPGSSGCDYGCEREAPHKAERILALLPKVFAWARSAGPSQPLTSALFATGWSSWDKWPAVGKIQIQESDILSFHSYDPPEEMERRIASLEPFHRPILCTEYMARPRGSTFQSSLPLFKRRRIGAFNWGFVAGKTQTYFAPQGTKQPEHFDSDPKPWFHDIFRTDGRPYEPEEVRFIREITGKSSSQGAIANPPASMGSTSIATPKRVSYKFHDANNAIRADSAIHSSVASAKSSKAQDQPTHRFVARDGSFFLDGKPFQIISGEMHYPRVPRAYWRERFRMAKAMGLNAITTYVFWNLHEPKPGVYDFSGNKDVAEYIREAQQEGLYVVLRPGPYVCSEWDFGGYPAWLLKDHSIVVRSSDPKFIEPATRWMKRIGQELAPLQVDNGGPILLIQLENEYGAFSDDHAYMEQMRQIFLDVGFSKSPLYTADGFADFAKGSLPELMIGANFGGWDFSDAERAVAALQQTRPDKPFFNSEFWTGWFDHWAERHKPIDSGKVVSTLDWWLGHGYSVSLYMFHGGTTFGWMNGANTAGKKDRYQPDVNSYDYDAPLDESGRPTPKYFAMREVIAKITKTTLPSMPETKPLISILAFVPQESASLWSNLPKPVHSEQPLTMEDLDQAYGYILYRTKIEQPVAGDLVFDELHDYARVYLNGEFIGSVDRRSMQTQLSIDVKTPGTRLDILVENSGRVNYATVFRKERKGITAQVILAGQPLLGWDIYSLPMLDPAKQKYSRAGCSGPCFYRAPMNISARGDTFLDPSAYTKGQVWMNGQALGRYWNVGPVHTLFVPGPWLRKGKNEVIVFDLDGQPGRALKGIEKPVVEERTSTGK